MTIEHGLRLSVYLGERDRADGGLLADVLIDLFARHRVRTSALLRGIEGFGIKHRLHSERLLTLSEDLPLVALALDTTPRIEAVLEEVRALARHGLITLERARLLSGAGVDAALAPAADDVKLTIHLARQARVAGRPAYLAAVECLHRHGVAGASVLLGLDGTAQGVRQRARFFARNAQVPLLIQSVGESARIAAAVGELSALLSEPAITLERVRVCKRDGALLAEPLRPPAVDTAGLAYWQKLVVYASEQTREGNQPLHSALVRRLRAEGAAGATALRGLWGYHGDHRPHGERFWSIRRHVPVLTVLVDTPASMSRWFEIVDELTRETGLVTSEIVPALRASGPGIEHGGLELAQPHGGKPPCGDAQAF
jgi:PII-like signaling protein